jgi:hypothetical protein
MKDRVVIENVIRAGEHYLLSLVKAVTKGTTTEQLDIMRTELLDAIEKLAQAIR